MSLLDALERSDLLVPLVTGHLLADFVFQTDRMAAHKDRWSVLAAHGAVVALASWLLLGLTPAGIPLVLLVTVLHLVIDLAKGVVERRTSAPAPAGPSRAPGGAFWPRNRPATIFLADQTVHALSLLVAITLVDALPSVHNPVPGTGLWAAAFGASHLPLLVLVSGWIVATTGTGYFFGHFLQRFEAELEPDQRGGLSGGGYWIGVTERSLIYLFILLGEPAAIGFLAAAKSVFRIGELRESKDRKLAEYILIGTLMSFAAAMLVGLATRAVVELLARR